MPRQAPRRPRLAEIYAALESLLRSTPRGRWFLAEHARRNRSAETDMLLGAIGRVENAVLRPAARKTGSSNAFDEHLIGATEGLDRIAAATANATLDILEAAEEIHEAAWMLRARGTDIALCDMIDRRATDISTACAFQDIAGQQSQRVAEALGLIEERINAMIEILGVDDIAAKGQHAASQAGPAAAALREGAGTLASAALAAIAAVGAAFAPEPLTLAAAGTVKRAALFG